jgi:hypothetical protein
MAAALGLGGRTTRRRGDQAAAARAAGISTAQLCRALTVTDRAPELVQSVTNGLLSLDLAYRIARGEASLPVLVPRDPKPPKPPPRRPVTYRTKSGRLLTREGRPTALDRGEHGTAGYTQGCRCRLCVAATRESERRRRHELIVLNENRVPYTKSVAAGFAARHARKLIADGWSVEKIAANAGLNPETVHRVLRGRTARSSTARAILDV